MTFQPQQKSQKAAERQNEIIKTVGDSQFNLAKNDKPDDEVSKEEKEAQEYHHGGRTTDRQASQASQAEQHGIFTQRHSDGTTRV